MNTPRLDEKGHEIPDPQPVEVPAGFKRPETLAEQIRRLVRNEEFQRDLAAQGMETFEEAEDFEIDDDMFDPSSPFEEVFDPVLGRGITLDEFRRNEAVYQQRFIEADKAAYAAMEASEALRARPRKQVTEPSSEDQQSSRAASERVSSKGNDNEK